MKRMFTLLLALIMLMSMTASAGNTRRQASS